MTSPVFLPLILYVGSVLKHKSHSLILKVEYTYENKCLKWPYKMLSDKMNVRTIKM